MSQYTAKDIEVLEGLEPVRKRPAMYIGGVDARGYHHLLWEIVDNAVDEVINGYASEIEVVIDADNKGARVTDNGRGIPVDIHPKYKRSALELILCTLHAGGKFEGKNYQVSGGLHGVGSSVVNALSESLTATVFREGSEYEQSYQRGTPTGKVRTLNKSRKRGTAIYFRPDPEIFKGSASFDWDTIKERLEAKSYLHRGLKVYLRHEGTKESVEFFHAQGIADYLNQLVAQQKKKTVHPNIFSMSTDEGASAKDGLRMELSLVWTESSEESIRTFANGIPTASGGTHEAGLRQALSKAIRNTMQTKNVVPKGVTIAAEDVREGVVAILSVYVRDPQFQGQTKDRLNNPEVASQVEGLVRSQMEQWLLENPSTFDAVVGRIVLSARARAASRAASAEVIRKTAVSHRLNLPGKLSDCASTNPEESELFLVEGDSAGGNAKQGRNRRTQAILPLRGKVLNTERASVQHVIGNKELQDIVSALGCGVGKTFDITKLRYGKIFLLMDADSDGHHIATLLLTFFFRMLPELIRAGRVFLAQPPLYRIDAGKQTYWALDDVEREKIIASLPKNSKPEISRFKGLGEMTADELKATTLDPVRRRAIRVQLDRELEADRVFQDLMGKDAAPRYQFIMDNAPTLAADQLDL